MVTGLSKEKATGFLQQIFYRDRLGGEGGRSGLIRN